MKSMKFIYFLFFLQVICTQISENYSYPANDDNIKDLDDVYRRLLESTGQGKELKNSKRNEHTGIDVILDWINEGAGNTEDNDKASLEQEIKGGRRGDDINNIDFISQIPQNMRFRSEYNYGDPVIASPLDKTLQQIEKQNAKKQKKPKNNDGNLDMNKEQAVHGNDIESLLKEKTTPPSIIAQGIEDLLEGSIHPSTPKSIEELGQDILNEMLGVTTQTPSTTIPPSDSYFNYKQLFLSIVKYCKIVTYNFGSIVYNYILPYIFPFPFSVIKDSVSFETFAKFCNAIISWISFIIPSLLPLNFLS